MLSACALFFCASANAQVSYGASASYGVRLLNATYKGNAVQVRRTCDNATKDIGFVCGALDVNTLTTFVIASNPLSAISSTSAAAFSLRRLICTYAGNAIKVRRSSDNTTQDIGFNVSGDLDTVSLKTFVGAGSGFITTWYDQSGNTRNALQATAGSQPRIVNAGVIDRQNNMPAIYFPGSGYGLFTAGFTAFASAACFNGVARVNTNLTYNTIVNKTNVNFPSPLDHYNGTVVIGDGGSGTYTFFSPSQTLNSTYPLGVWTYQGSSGGNVSMYHNSTSILSGTATYFGDAGNPLAIGNRNDALTGLNGWVSEVITFGSIPSNTDRLFLEWSQSQYYNISGFTLGTLPASPASGYIATWYDQSGNSVNLTQTTFTNQPQIVSSGTILQLKSLPTIVGTNTLQTSLTGSFSSSYTGSALAASTVFQPDISSTGNLRVMSVGTGTTTNDWSSNSLFDINQRGNTNLVIERNGISGTSAITVGSPISLGVVFDGTNDQLFINGTGSATTGDTKSFSFNTLRVLNSINPGFSTEAMTGRMSEYYMFQSAFNTTRRILLETNQAAYYSLTISNNKYTVASGYNLFVNGVGRTSVTDSVADSRQSAGMGFIVGITGTDYLKDDGDYITAGMTCPTANVTTSSFMPTGATAGYERWLNDWYINKTDVSSNGGNLKIFFDFSDYGVSGVPANASNYQLWGRASTASNFTVVPTTTVAISGDRVVFNLPAANLGTTGYYTLGSIDYQNSPLPIELLDFTAVPNDNKVNIKWETTTETNNAYFTIEKSKDGINFTKLIDIPGAGNSISLKEYVETDYQPYSGTSYYRLKQTDYNGNFKYFNTVSVNFDSQKNIFVYPNPIDNTSNFTIELNGYKNQEVVVVLRDIQGREFLSKVLLSSDDNQIFILDKTNSLAAGTYIVTASSNDKIYNYKLIVK